MEKEANIHYRGVSSIMKLWQEDHKIERAPSHETCIQWDLKTGFYKLQQAKQKDTPWCWMVDHLIGEGYMKCLAIVGVPLDILQNKTDWTLSLQQLEPFGFVPMYGSDGDKVKNALLQVTQQTGITPQAIVSDHGSDLWLGVKEYCKCNNGQTVELYDISHMVALEIKKQLLKDSDWNEFSTRAAEAKRQLYSTKGVFFAPPNQRRKGRYMNVDILIGWANRILEQYEQIPEYVLEKLSWVWKMREKVVVWGQWVEIAKQSRDQIRKNGFHVDARDHLEEKLLHIPMVASSMQLSGQILSYIAIESNKLEHGCKMIGTTEPLESLFGYYKQVKNAAWDSYGGLGRLILAMASRLGGLTEELVKKSLEYSTVKQVNEWLAGCLV